MVYISSWQAFQEAAENLYAKSPFKTRYCVKWRACEGKLVLKVTDDVQCIKYKTHSSIFLNRFETLNLTLMEKMQNCPSIDDDHQKMDVTSTTPQVPDARQSPAPRPSDTPLLGASGSVAAGGIKKKKKGKKK